MGLLESGTLPNKPFRVRVPSARTPGRWLHVNEYQAKLAPKTALNVPSE